MGGQGAPFTLSALSEEMISGSNTAFNMYPGLSMGAAEVIQHFGTDAQRKKYVAPMMVGKFGGTMCLTEPHAGSDVGIASTAATKNADGTARTASAAPRSSSRAATTTSPRTSSTSCSRASRARAPAPRASRSSSCRACA
jgi:alkylation response protein AidB-like acyl-CoA dehydrogenase